MPATIGVLDGQAMVGMNELELERLAEKPTGDGKRGWGGRGAVKVSRRDLAAVLALGGRGGTTVAGTM